MMAFFKNQKGQALLEALIALGAATIVMSAIALAVISSVNNSDFSKYQNQATQYSQQGIEILKQQSVSAWPTFSGYTSGSTYCFPSGATLTLSVGVNCSPNIGTNDFFVRSAVITKSSLDCPGNPNDAGHRGTLVSVSTAWSDGKCKDSANLYCHSVVLNSCITDVNRVASP